jgi:hypothetical protein
MAPQHEEKKMPTSKLTGKTVARLMRIHKRTIREIATYMDIPLSRVRQVRSEGVSGAAHVTDWLEAIC